MGWHLLIRESHGIEIEIGGEKGEEKEDDDGVGGVE